MRAMDTDQLYSLAGKLRHSNTTAPRDVIWAVASLLDVESADADAVLLCWSTTYNDTTLWHVLGLTPDLVMTVSASANRVPWTFTSDADGPGHSAPDSLSATVRPRASVSRLEVTAFEDISTWTDRLPPEWRTTWRIHFDDGKTFDLADQSPKNDEAARSLLADLRSR